MKKILISTIALFSYWTTNAQDLDSLMNSLSVEEPTYATATFKATRIINLHSVEQLKAKHLDFRIHHRFGPVNQGVYELFGLDAGKIFLSLEYGLTDWCTIGLGRTNENKTFNGFSKFRVLRQSDGSKNMPVSLSLYAGADMYTEKNTQVNLSTASRLSYIYQVLVARKFNESFSLQITPGVIHQNLTETALDNNDLWFVATGGRYKLSRRISLNAEYNYAIRPNYIGANSISNNLSIGFDIETGGHVFQLMLTNSQGMIERKFINNTLGSWGKGDIVLGFNISRIFSFSK